MNIVVPVSELSGSLIKQLEIFFPFSEEEAALVPSLIFHVLPKVDFCFSNTSNKYYKRNGETYFSPFHSGQYCIFLYFLSREAFLSHHPQLADKIYYLNKIMNACDLFYEVELPTFFMLDHPIGAVMGRASYGNGFMFTQNCTVGNNNGVYPVIGTNVHMCMNSAILGDCHIGNNVILGAGTIVKDEDIPANSMVFGQSPNLVIKQR